MKDGGPAFPQTIDDMGTLRSVTEGMSLRDYFAAHATDGDIKDIQSSLGYPVSRRQARYMHADAMLAERAKGAA